VTGDTHYDLEVLAELAEGLLDEATADQVREHLAVCDSCGENLADLAAVRELLASVPVPAMPLGVAKRIDQALAAEAERLTLGAPWEEITPEPVPADDRPAPAPAEAPADAPAEPVRLGVVAEDGTVVPVQPKKRARSSARRRFSARRWALTAAAAAAVVMGGTGVTAGLLAAEGGGSPEQTYVASEPTGTATAGQPSYTVYASGHNYTSEELKGPGTSASRRVPAPRMTRASTPAYGGTPSCSTGRRSGWTRRSTTATRPRSWPSGRMRRSTRSGWSSSTPTARACDRRASQAGSDLPPVVTGA